MSATSVSPPAPPTAPAEAPKTADRRWMISPAVDCCLILLTPLIAAPIVLLAASSNVGVEAATIGLVVASFFALGHHLPGLIRAYGDPGLFQRFKWRFILAPPLVFLAYFPLYQYHFALYRLIILSWATWHGFMQLYGFVRIYDAKVGCTSKATANWDWLVCLCGFLAPNVLGPQMASRTLGHWYSAGGPVISPTLLSTLRWAAIAVCVVVLAGFTINYIRQSLQGPRPNPLKVVMLASGIGTWWFALCFVEELILGIALFDICHDVQYNAIVWMYNRRLVNSGSQVGGFMRFLFRRGMVLLYLGLITAYGALGLLAPLVENGSVSRFFYGLIFTSTILHYYYDGFIWKVRDPANQANLGVKQSGTAGRLVNIGGMRHALKWSPVVLVLGLLFVSDAMDPPLTTAEKNRLDQTYVSTLQGKPILPQKPEEVSWVYNQFKATQDIAAAVPDDRRAQLLAAVALANFGRNDEAIRQLEDTLEASPDYRDAHVALSDIHFYLGDLDQSTSYSTSALAISETAPERAAVNQRLGEIALRLNDSATAEQKFEEALRDDPEIAESVEELMAYAGRPPRKKTATTGSAYP